MSRVVLTLLAISVVAGPLVFAQAQAPVPPPGAIVAIVHGLRSDRGNVRVGIYDGPAHWPEADRNFAGCVSPIHNRQASCAIRSVRPGAMYAIAFDHDENANSHFDTNFIGLPLEGYGFSNDAHPRLGAPSFDRCRFLYPGGTFTVTMTAQY
jgi:uncharacterized protein (DUF2141 family)